MQNGEYARVALSEDGAGARSATSEGPTTPWQRRLNALQWCCLAMLTAVAAVVLAIKVVKRAAVPMPHMAAIYSAADVNGTAAANAYEKRRRGRRWMHAMTMGRHGASSSFINRTPRRNIKKQTAKAATRSVVLIGSHFGLGSDLLKRVFGELCQRARLSLRCEATWGGTHDLKSLADFKGRKKRLVWLESDAQGLLTTLKNLKAHTVNYRLVHVLWDPMQACMAQWPLAEHPAPARAGTAAPAANASFSEACDGLMLDSLMPLYRRAKRDRVRALQLRLEDLVTKKGGVGAATWRSLFKFLELAQVSGDLTAVGTRAVSELELRAKVRNTNTPSWVRGAIGQNATHLARLRRMRRELDYNKQAREAQAAIKVASSQQ